MADITTLLLQGYPVPQNEDRYLVQEFANAIWLAVMDGVTEILHWPRLDPLLQQPDGTLLTPGAFAAEVTRQAMTRLLAADPSCSPADILLAANEELALRLASAGIAGDWDALLAESDLASLTNDTRAVRLVLPATTATIVKIDIHRQQMEWAWVGDSPLFAIDHDTTHHMLTIDQRTRHTPDPLWAHLIQHELPRSAFPARLHHLPEAFLMRDAAGRLLHNYQTTSGATEITRGIGVIDGLPAMSAYLQQQSCSLDGIAYVLLCTDGWVWPGDRDGGVTCQQTIASGLATYSVRLRQEQTRQAGILTGPRVKDADDATAVLLAM